ncbi:MAG TPA: hypothetical protein ENK23_03665, partial [Sorangium sp.]|nr:hypothetical protein [Sorangium sp.]
MTMDTMLVLACGLVWLIHIVQLTRRRGRSFVPALAIALFGVGVSLAVWQWLPAHAGAAAMALVALLLIVPQLAIREASRALKWGRIGRARALARIARVLRPLAVTRQFCTFVEISWRLNRGDGINVDQALSHLGPLSQIERDTNALAFLSWTSDFRAM